ncbi:MAG: phosphoenolpyruvate carboxykinase (GTP) [Desulfobulbaceae bacterium]|nr:phosphoenolpyruvate carboxykinase (GTP) [Desulfobulbaceae bacterium]
MFTLRQGDDILAAVSGIHSADQAEALLCERLDAATLAKLARNEDARLKIAAAIAICQPDAVFINSGNEADVRWIRQHALATGEERALAKAGHSIHFDLPEDQGRLINQTYYVVNPGETTNSLAKAMRRDEVLVYARKYLPKIMVGKIMMIGFYSRGPIGAIVAWPAIEISSSAYVLHSAEILYRNCHRDFDDLARQRGAFFTNLHAQGANTAADIANARIFIDRAWQTTIATFCAYAGNTLHLKKGNHRLAVDYATYFQKGERLSEHMFITGVQNKEANGRVTYFAGAAPSGCGKTTTAMVGEQFIGDDLAQLWIDDQGGIRAINPEQGIFGIVEDVNRDGDPLLMDCLRGDGVEVIWSNVLIDDQYRPRWTGDGEPPPLRGVNYQGEWRRGQTDDTGKPAPMSHKNARCTLLASAIANHATRIADDPEGAPIQVITYSGRDADTMPPVWVAKSAEEGVAIGASLVSAATATETGASGVKRQPWANAPFIPGALGDYMAAQLAFFTSEKLRKPPVMAGLNYFLTHAERGGAGEGLLGEKRDVRVWLAWLERFAHGECAAIDTPIGFLPRYEDLRPLFSAIGKVYEKSLYDQQFSLYIDNIIRRIELQETAYRRETGIPATLFAIYARQKAELLRVKEQHGAISLPEFFPT